jgi:predicted nucleic acid-binding protein
MSGVRVFVDTNVLIYAFTENEPDKREMALTALDDSEPVISTQVLKEFSNVLLGKMGCDNNVVTDTLTNITDVAEILVESVDLVFGAIRLHDKYGFSFYDSLIIEAALVSNCEILLSEDLHDGQIIDGKLKIVNPFK